MARVTLDPGDTAAVTVLVAETGLKRERSGQELVAMMWPMLALVVAAGLSIVLAVRGAVHPLRVDRVAVERSLGAYRCKRSATTACRARACRSPPR